MIYSILHDYPTFGKKPTLSNRPKLFMVLGYTIIGYEILDSADSTCLFRDK
jgi:hypothetical protein